MDHTQANACLQQLNAQIQAKTDELETTTRLSGYYGQLYAERAALVRQRDALLKGTPCSN